VPPRSCVTPRTCCVRP